MIPMTANKLFISTGEVDHDMAEDLQRLKRNQNYKWLKITALNCAYRTLTYLPLIY